MNLLKRRETYHFRMRVPSDLRGIFARNEIQQSLKTDDKRTARSRSLKLSRQLNEGFDTIRHARTSKVEEDVIEHLISELLTSLGSTRRKTGNRDTEKTVTTLSSLIKVYLDEKAGSVESRTLETMRYSFQLASHFIGDIRLHQLNRSICREYRNQLAVSSKYLLRDEGASSKHEVLSAKSVNKHIQFFSTMLRWAAREELLVGNPAEDLTIRRKVSNWKERFAFSEEELQALLRNLWNDEQRSSRRWVPFISLFSGMRIEEICQLRHCDIIEDEGILCFSISPEAGAVKTAAAERLTPIHSKLIEMGLLKLVKTDEKKALERIWSDLAPNKYGRYSNAVGKWFGRYKTRKGFDDSRYCFHSLRHTFINSLKQMDTPEPIIRQMVGHTEQSITLGRYGKRYETAKMKHWIDKLKFK